MSHGRNRLRLRWPLASADRLGEAAAAQRLHQQAATASASTPDEMKELLVREIALRPGVITRAKVSIKA
jgi:hypothetical protein